MGGGEESGKSGLDGGTGTEGQGPVCLFACLPGGF